MKNRFKDLIKIIRGQKDLNPEEININGKRKISYVMQDNKMEPEIMQGQRVIIDPYKNKIEDDEIYLFKVNGKYKLRKLKRKEKVYLKKFIRQVVETSILNTSIEYQPVLIPLNEVEIIGRLSKVSFD